MPSLIDGSFKRRSSRALRKAIATVANGFSFVPSFLSEPFPETQISAARAFKTIQNEKKRKMKKYLDCLFIFYNLNYLFEKWILHTLYLRHNSFLHYVGLWHPVIFQPQAIRSSPFYPTLLLLCAYQF